MCPLTVGRLAPAALCALGLVSFVPVAAHASKSQSLSTRISLPSGPGSIAGLGGEFKPSLASGTASYEVAITPPPSAGNLAPSLALSYDSGGGASDIGLGWTLSGLPRIRRRTENGLPTFAASDPLEVLGLGTAADLLEIAPNTFRPQYESGAFVRVQRSADGTAFEARDKAGLIYKFGGEGFTEGDGGKTATWLLREQRDLFGHVIRYQWTVEDGHARLAHVVFNDSSPEARNEIALAYEDRPDPFTRFSNGFRERLTKRLSSVDVLHGGKLVRRYALAYGTDKAHSRLGSVTELGSDGVTKLPTLSFGYTASLLVAGSAAGTVAMKSPPGRSLADANLDLADMDGDGLPDLVVSKAGAWSVYPNQDGLSWRPRVDWATSASPSLELAATGVQLADIDGDGAIDVVAKSGVDFLRYLKGKGIDGLGESVTISPVPNFTFEDPDVRLADMDGDRRTDAVITTAAGLAIAYNQSGAKWAEPVLLGEVDPKQPLRFSDGGHTQLCDVNGDRVLDLCHLRSESLVYYLGRGRGRFEPAQVATGVPSFDASAPFQLVDLDGDGRVDLVRVGVTQVEFALADGEGHFGGVQSLAGTPYRGPDTTVRFADMNGSGTTDIVWVNVSGSPDAAWQYLELFPSGRAGLLATIDNGLGKKVTITYAPAALDAAAAREASKPWSTRMNAAMPVVRRIAVDSGLGDPTVSTEYHYGDGTYSPVERTFAGFGFGLERAVGDEWTPTLVTETTFDVGLADRTQRGLVLSTLTRDELGHLFQRTTSSYVTRKLEAAADGRFVTYTFRAAEKVEHIEGTDPSKARTTLTEFDQDKFGNTIATKKWGEVVGADKLVGNDEAISLSTFANNEADWILGKLASEELQDGSGKRIRLARRFYDGADFTGLPLGQVAKGLVTREDAWVSGETFELTNSARFDGHGNVLETRDARGGGRLYTYDPAGVFLVEETIKTGGLPLVQKAEHDGAFGTILWATAFNGAVSSFGYDPLGRVATVVRPGDSFERPTIQYAYSLGAPLSSVVRTARVFSGRDETETGTTYFDGLGRRRGVVAPSRGRWALTDVTLFDARGQVRRMARGRWMDSSAPGSALVLDAAGTSFRRDALGRELTVSTTLGFEKRFERAPFVERLWDAAQSDSKSTYEHTPLERWVDGLGRTVRMVRTLGGRPNVSRYDYDASGALTLRTDPDGHSAAYAYDGKGRRVEARDPDAGVHRFAYDSVDNLIGHLHPDGGTALFSFDLMGRPLIDDWNGDGVPDVTRTYDQGPNAQGKLSSAVSPAGTVSYGYDGRQRLTKTTLELQGGSYVSGQLFDALDRAYLHVYPDGSSIRLGYDERGMLTTYGKDALVVDYDADGLELARRFSTGVEEWQRYDGDRRRIESLARTKDGAILQRLEWVLDSVGNVVELRDKRPGLTKAADRSEVYTLDNLYRLTKASGTWGETAWSYSGGGNILAKTSSDPRQHAGPISYGKGGFGPHAPRAFRDRVLAWDGRGRLVDDGVRKFTWNAADQLTGVTTRDGAEVASLFDHVGARRVRKETQADGVHATHFVDDWAEVRDGTLHRFIVHAGQRVARLGADNGVAGASSPAAILDSADAVEPPSAGGCSTGQAQREPPTRRGRIDPIQTLLTCLLIVVVGHRYRARLRAVARAAGPLLVLLAASALGSTACGSKDAGLPAIADGSIQSLSGADELLWSDAVGSLTETTTGDGTAVGTSATFPYGLDRAISAPVSLSRVFANTPRDRAVGVDQMGARAYVPELGIWASPDPLAIDSPESLVGGEVGAANPYAYAANHPVTTVDRAGRMPWVVAALGVAAVGAILLTPQTVNAPAPGDKLQTKSTGQLALDTAHNAAMGFGLLAAAGAVAEAAVVGGVGAAAQTLGHIVVGSASMHVLGKEVDKIDPSGNTRKVLDIVAVGGALGKAPEGALGAKLVPGGAPGSRPGLPFTKVGKRLVIEANQNLYGGRTVCSRCAMDTVPAKQHLPGKAPPQNETQVDHIKAESHGGSGDPSNGQVLCRFCNIRKSNK